MTCAQFVQTLTWRRYQPGAGVGVGVGVGCTIHGIALYVAVWASTFAYCVVPGGLHAPEVARVPCAKPCAAGGCFIWSSSSGRHRHQNKSQSRQHCHQPNCHNQYQLGVLFRPSTVMICDSIRLPIRVRCIRPTCQGNGIRTHGRTEVCSVALPLAWGHPWSYRRVRCIALTCHGMAFAPMVGVRCIALTCHGGGLRTHGRTEACDVAISATNLRVQDVKTFGKRMRIRIPKRTRTRIRTRKRTRIYAYACNIAHANGQCPRA